MRRGLLVFNPEATSVSPRVRDVIAHALASELKLDVAETKRRHHATHLAIGAAHEGFDIVAVLGGDGTLNEVVNGLAGTDVTVVALPGGGTNVFSRTLGLPNDPIEATGVVLERIAENAPARRINLGKINGRAFAFCAGIGFDAAVVRAVERRFRLKRKIGEGLFVAQTLRTFFFVYPRHDPPLTLHAGGESITHLHEVASSNSNPFTFLGRRPFQVCPEADQDLGLDVMALTKLGTAGTLRMVWRAFGSGGHTRLRHVRALHDLSDFSVESSRPVPYQVDGDFAGEDTQFRFEVLPQALNVLA
ncbi:MAG: diacylglycerol kinase family protein [Actinomycetota bacterium]